jgi:transcriptional regulator with XRE-family HTH domain
MMMATIGSLLKRHRDRHGWTQQEVVDRAGLDRSSSYLSSIETNKTSPTIGELDALARLFGTTSVDLLQEATGLNAELEFEPDSDLNRLLTLYQALDP